MHTASTNKQHLDSKFYLGMKLLVDELDFEFVYSEITCEFWIHNFQFEIFYDLTKHCDTSELADKLADPLIIPTSIEDAGTDTSFHINSLPTELFTHIFGFLTAVELLTVKSVCSRWQEIVDTDKALWNHVVFSAADFDVKTTASLLKEMPLLKTVDLCNVHSPEDMTLLTTALCNDCWELHRVLFPEASSWQPSSHDLYNLMYYHPRITSLQLCTKQKLTPAEISNIGVVLSGFTYLTHLKLVGYYWHQAELLPDLLAKLPHLTSLALPSIPGLTGPEVFQLKTLLPNLKSFTLNTSSLREAQLNHLQLTNLEQLSVIDSSSVTKDKLIALGKISNLTYLNINLSGIKLETAMSFFGVVHSALTSLTVSNCEFSNDLLAYIPRSCPNLRILVWLNPKQVTGEITDDGILSITRLTLLHRLEIKSRSVSKAHYPDLAGMKALKYARINGLRVPGCL